MKEELTNVTQREYVKRELEEKTRKEEKNTLKRGIDYERTGEVRKNRETNLK